MHQRELHFWDRENEYLDGNGISKYLRNFPTADDRRMFGEKTPGYLSSPEAAGRIAKHFPKVKIVAILRDPADRAYSAFWHGKRVGAIPANVTFRDAIRNHDRATTSAWQNVVANGFYSTQLKRYSDHFPMSQIKVLSFSNTLKDHAAELNPLLSFLLSDSMSIRESNVFEFPIVNKARVSRFPAASGLIYKSKIMNQNTKRNLIKKTLIEFEPPKMEWADREFLKNLYSEEAPIINKIFGTKFDW